MISGFHRGSCSPSLPTPIFQGEVLAGLSPQPQQVPAQLPPWRTGQGPGMATCSCEAWSECLSLS